MIEDRIKLVNVFFFGAAVLAISLVRPSSAGAVAESGSSGKAQIVGSEIHENMAGADAPTETVCLAGTGKLVAMERQAKAAPTALAARAPNGGPAVSETFRPGEIPTPKNHHYIVCN